MRKEEEGFYMPTYTNIPGVLKDEIDCAPICERCGSHNMKIEDYEGSIFYGWWKCMDCGNVGDKAEEEE